MDRILILLDLTRLFFTARRLHINIGYKQLGDEIKQELVKHGSAVEVVGFTTVFDGNVAQAAFLSSLEDTGILVRRYPPILGKNNYLAEMLAYSDAEDSISTFLVTNAEEAVRCCATYKDSGKDCSLVYFSGDIPRSWSIADLSYDLSDPEALKRVGDFALGHKHGATGDAAQLRLHLGA